MGQTFVKRAAALRDKYRARDLAGSPTRRLPPELVASHPLNRNGVRLNGQRCEELFQQVLSRKQKCVYQEALHGSVRVEVARVPRVSRLHWRRGTYGDSSDESASVREPGQQSH